MALVNGGYLHCKFFSERDRKWLGSSQKFRSAIQDILAFLFPGRGSFHDLKDDYFFRRQPVAWKEYSTEYWKKEFQESMEEFQESMDRLTGRHNLTEITVKTALTTCAINHSINPERG